MIADIGWERVLGQMAGVSVLFLVFFGKKRKCFFGCLNWFSGSLVVCFWSLKIGRVLII